MKKIALSFFVIAVSGAYVWSQWDTETMDAVPGLPGLVGDATAAPRPPSPPKTADDAPAPDGQPSPVKLSLMFLTDFKADSVPSPSARADAAELPAPAPAEPPAPTPVVAETAPAAEIPIPRPRPAHWQPVASEPPRRGVSRAALTLTSASAATYADGRYVGPRVDAFYGIVQVEAVVLDGKLNTINVLRYPSHRRTSRAISNAALPRLSREVVRAQSAKVNIVSGATLTSEAFIRSVDGALKQARA